MRDEYIDMLLNQKEALEITLDARSKENEELKKENAELEKRIDLLETWGY